MSVMRRASSVVPFLSFVRSRGHIFSLIIMKFGQNVCLDETSDDPVGSKKRSLGQILEKPCVRSRGHISSLIIMKLGQNVCLDETWTTFKVGHGGSKTRSLDQILEKHRKCSRGHIFSPIIMNLGQNLCLDEISDES